MEDGGGISGPQAVLHNLDSKEVKPIWLTFAV
jgi:hypothetical protein